MNFIRHLIVGFFCLIWPLVTVAQTADPCRSWPVMQEYLADQFSEGQVWVGLRPDGAKIVITENPDGTTWSAVIIRPDGTACIVSFGDAWSDIPQTPPGEES